MNLKNFQITKELSNYKFKYSLYKDSLGRQHAIVIIKPTQELSKEQSDLIDTVKKTLRIKSVDKITKLTTSTTTTINTKFNNDSLNYTDGFLTIDLIKDSSDSVRGFVNYTDSCIFVEYTKNKRFLGIKYNKEQYLDLWCSNPNTTIKGLTRVDLTKYNKPKRFGLGVQVGYSTQLKPYIGVGLSYNILNF